ncbi:MAG: penicillin acylase family protein [Planctomycetaceae bacterium]|jgi:penicillin amidase
MSALSRELLRRLGAGESISQLCASQHWSRAEFDAWWRSECLARVPVTTGTLPLGGAARVQIARDQHGIPHITAEEDVDLFFGFGLATAQDRLFQLDLLRRRALGRLAEVLGPTAVDSDLTARTVGLPQIAAREWDLLPAETRTLVQAWTEGVNAWIGQVAGRLPIEFDLLDYTPEPWSPVDCLAIAGEFRWYLTGRFPVIVIPELARRVLGEGPLYREFLQAEADAASILNPGEYPAQAQGVQPVGVSVNDPQEGHGSNNWVVGGERTTTGKPFVASDPHIAFAAVSCWYEVHLQGGSFHVAGIAYAGMPAVMFGRTPRVAWGITNNICSLRDLYQERTDPAHPGCFLFGDGWEPWHERVEMIVVKGAPAQHHVVRLSRNGPIVDAILPEAARSTGPVALRWLGSQYCGWLPALHAMARAPRAQELREATRPWLVPTFCVVYADVDGEIGYQCTGRLPLRAGVERGYRQGWNPDHQWRGLIPFEGLPHLANPARGWIGTANNRVAPDDFPYPLSGTWSNGYRGERIRQMLESTPRAAWTDMVQMQLDTVSLRARDCLPPVLALLDRLEDPQLREIACVLQSWDHRVEIDRVGATLFNVFFQQWCQQVAAARFSSELVSLMAGACGGLAQRLLRENVAGWFPDDASRLRAFEAAWLETLAWLTNRLGAGPGSWTWGRLHLLQQKHSLTGLGDLGQLLDRGAVAVRGDMQTVCNSGQAHDFSAPTGAGYRMIADLGDPQGTLWAIDAGSESGVPGSRHYDDQLAAWVRGEYHPLRLFPTAEQTAGWDRLTLVPREGQVSD